ncbi:hypothetical protein MidiMira_16 [Proteus phage MidiMira-UFV02]|nr:hypothetical protein BigMira_16 [Proteus phage BigMira-UFV01]WJJ57743.1 hypothetical protein MidiMira_16 [Proteus phage MidiMira-UFV02]
MTKVLIHKDNNGILEYAVVTPFGVKPFGIIKSSAIRCAKLLASWHQTYAGNNTEEEYKKWQKLFGCKYVGEFFVEHEDEE